MSQGLKNQLQSFIKKTEEGKVPWKFINQNAIQWVKQEGNRVYTTTIQVQPNQRINNSVQNNYILSIHVSNPNEVVLQLNGMTDTIVLHDLMTLFEKANLHSKSAQSEIIDKLLGDL